MARGKKSGGRDWKPGQSGNPLGNGAYPKDVRDAKALNKVEFARIAQKYLDMKPDEIKAAVANPDTPMKELMVATVMIHQVKQGDPRRLEFLLNRLIGRVPIRMDAEEVDKPVTHSAIYQLLEEIKKEGGG